MEKLMIALMVALIGAVVIVAVLDLKKPSITLDKKEWVCRAYESHTRFQTVTTGKVVTTVPITTSECVQYNRKSHE